MQTTTSRRRDDIRQTHRRSGSPTRSASSLTAHGAIARLQRQAGNQAVGALLASPHDRVRGRPASSRTRRTVPASRSRRPRVQRCGDTPPSECPCHDHNDGSDHTDQTGQLAQRTKVQRTSIVVQRAAPAAVVAAGPVIGHCLLGAASTLALDVVAQNIDAVAARVARTAQQVAEARPHHMMPQHALAAGGGFRGLMERDRRRAFGPRARQRRRQRPPTLPEWKFDKCRALISVMVGCVFGVAGGAVRTWLMQTGRWTYQGIKALMVKAGYEQAMGKWGLPIAKLGCKDAPLDDVPPRSPAEVEPRLRELTAGGADADEEGPMCVAEPQQTSSEPEELVCRAP